ncbi:thioredoxin family protein [Robertkochia flava]|uniref:thioredoxin family protein n=1 Tax=Robertkochia flava TaxID=3447986 RepID=UPI001CC9C1F1|nr:thioredoxin family protein [Robertkochia marina]
MMENNRSQVLDPVLYSALEEALSYEDFRSEVQSLLDTNRVTGIQQSDAYLHYTLMNEKRMDRWEKTFKMSDDQVEQVRAFSGDVTWLVITEGWCGDGAHALPVMKRIADLNEGIALRIVIRDEWPALMDAYLTNGARSIPKLIMIDNGSGVVLATWGPRPAKATAMVEREKQEKGTLSPEFRAALQMWYNKDKGRDIAGDLIRLLSLE